MMQCNLLSPSARMRVRVQDRIRSWSLALTCYLLFLTIGSIAAWSVSRVDAAIPAEVIAAAEADAKAIEASVDEAYTKVRQQRALLAAELAVGRHPDWSVLLPVIARLKGPSVDLSGIELRPMDEQSRVSKSARPARYVLQVVGTAPDHAQLAALVLRFEAVGIFEHVALAQNRITHEGQGVVEFVVHAEMDDAPAPGPKASSNQVKP